MRIVEVVIDVSGPGSLPFFTYLNSSMWLFILHMNTANF